MNLVKSNKINKD